MLNKDVDQSAGKPGARKYPVVLNKDIPTPFIGLTKDDVAVHIMFKSPRDEVRQRIANTCTGPQKYNVKKRQYRETGLSFV